MPEGEAPNRPRSSGGPSPPITAIVPTLGRSSVIADCLRHLRDDGGGDLRLVVVDQAPGVEKDIGDADEVLTTDSNLGFSKACNWALGHAEGELVAIVNDDAIVQPGWLANLTEVLAVDHQAASAQGMNLSLADSRVVDGCGIAWNRWWRPVQIGQGLRAESFPGGGNRKIFGASATAVLYRRRALAKVAIDGRHAFDPRLPSFYEDVDLAVRLRKARFDSLLVPSARCLHQGGATSQRISRISSRWRYSHRYLVLARLSGQRYWTRSILLFIRDVLDIGQFSFGANHASLRDIVRGWAGALGLLREFAHRGKPLERSGSFPTRVRSAASWPSMWTDFD